MNFGMVFTMEICIGDKLMSLRWRVGEVFEMHYTLSVVMSHTDLVCPRGMFSNPIRPVKTSTDFEVNFQRISTRISSEFPVDFCFAIHV